MLRRIINRSRDTPIFFMRQLMYNFSLTSTQLIKLNEWINTVNQKLIKEQKEKLSECEFEILTENGKYPYMGAIGGGQTYCFTPTSLGVITVVEYGGEKIDLTDYDMW